MRDKNNPKDKNIPLYLWILGYIVQHPTATNREIAKHANCHPRTVQRILSKLEEEGRIERRINQRFLTYLK